MHEIEEFLENDYGFSRTDWGFLNKTIDGIEYTLLHDPFNGYALQYSYVSKRAAAFDKINLGKNPTIDTLYEAFERILSNNDMQNNRTREVQNRRDKTFDYEDNQEHFVGSHFDAFFDDMQNDVMINIGEYTENSSVVESSHISDLQDISDDKRWQKGFILAYPKDNSDEGMGSIIGIVEEEKELTFISLFPHLNYGQIYELELNKVYVWSNGHEAQIEVDLGFTELAFYDIHYDVNRKFYFSGDKYKFQILGIAYSCENRVETEIEVETTPEMAKALDMPVGMRTVSLVGMASFIPIDSWDRDDYSYSGIIQNVKGVYISISDIKGWICTTRVLVEGSDSENIYDMDILVTEKIWKSKTAPKVGDDIEGSVWTQGRLL